MVAKMIHDYIWLTKKQWTYKIIFTIKDNVNTCMDEILVCLKYLALDSMKIFPIYSSNITVLENCEN